MWEYDPVTNTWTQQQNAPIARGSHSATVINGKMYVLGGCNNYEGVYFNTLWECAINTPPVMSVISPTENSLLLGTNTNFIPQISVSDADNDTLTCKYYIDSETVPRDTKTISNTSIAKNISFATLNMNLLSEESHIIKFEIDDGNSIVPITKTISY